MWHDHDRRHKVNGKFPCNWKGLMSYDMDWGFWEWSECSKKDFQAYYNVITQKKGLPWCMEGTQFGLQIDVYQLGVFNN